MGWKISDKPTVDPKDTDLVLIEQDGNTRNTTWAKLKAFFLGTATLTTTDQTIKGAINEVKASTDANTTSLSEKAKLVNTPQQTTANITYYIDTTNGNDSNNGTTSGTAFKTIQHAIDSLPQIINHNVTINLVAGTYSESVTIKGFSGKGYIAIVGSTSLSASVNYNVNNIIISNCSIYIKIQGINLLSTNTDGISIVGCINVYTPFCSCTSTSGTNAGIKANYSLVNIDTCNISNRLFGIIGLGVSNVRSNNNSGSNNTYALRAVEGSTITQEGIQPTGTTQESTIGGGVIREDIYNATLLNGWIINSFVPLKVARSGNIVTINGRIGGGTNIGGTQIALLPPQFRPVAGIYLPVANPSGTILGSIGVLETGAIIVQSAFTNNSDVCLNISYYVS